MNQDDKQLRERLMAHMSFSNSDLYDVFIDFLDSCIEDEQNEAISNKNSGEDRAWQCGRAASLKDFKLQITGIRKEVRDIYLSSNEGKNITEPTWQ